MADNDVRIKLSLDGADSVERGLSGIGSGASGAVGKLKGLAVGLAGLGTAAVASAGALGTAVVGGFAEYEQNIGGLETMFKDSAGKMQAYAEQAYQTAGMSANDYMSQVTSFSAALLQGLGGDTEAAADLANTAMVDMSDNANKFGSNISDIQNAYQGFAKQNYTMLDNLKLGYGGTQAEMARLINDSGVLGDTMEVTADNVNEVSFDKIIEAIHTVQDDMGVMGTTAKEASETISGSIGSTKAAFDNLLVGLGRGDADVAQLAGNVLDNAKNVVNNITPVIENIGSNMSKLGPQIGDLMSGLTDTIMQAVPPMLQAGVSLIKGLLEGIASAAPQLATSVAPLIGDLVNTIAEVAPQLIEGAVMLVTSLANGLSEQLPTLIPVLVDGILTMVEALIENAPLLLEAGVKLILALAQGIVQAIPVLLGHLPELFMGIVEALYEIGTVWRDAFLDVLTSVFSVLGELGAQIGEWLSPVIDGIKGFFSDKWEEFTEQGRQLGTSISDGFGSAISAIGELASGIWNYIVTGITSFSANLIAKGAELMHNISNGFGSAISSIVGFISNLGSTIIGGITNFFGSMQERGSGLINNLRNGMSSVFGTVTGAVGNLLSNIGSNLVGFFGTMLSHGTGLISNLANGMRSAFGVVTGAIGNLLSTVSGAIRNGVGAMVSAGADLVRGIWQGITNAGSWLKNQIAGWAKGIINHAKSMFKIASPSKVFRDEIGKQLMAGVAVGITQATDQPLKALDSMFKGVESRVNKGLKGVSTNIRREKNTLVGAFNELQDAFTWTGSGDTWDSNNMSALFDEGTARKILNAAESLGVVRDEIKYAFNGGDWGYGELASYVGDDAALKIVNLSAELGGYYRKAVSVSKDMIKTFNKATRDFTRSVESVVGMFGDIDFGFEELAGIVGSDNAQNLLNAVESYNEVAKEIKTAFDGGDWGYAELSNYIGDNLAKSVVNQSAKLGEQYRSSVKMGQEMVNGIWSGINRSTSGLQHKIHSWSRQLIKDTKKQFGIASPSKVFRDAIGRNLMLGVADGINGNSYTVTNSVYAMFSDLQPALKDGMEGARQTIEEGLDSWKNPEAVKGVVDEFTGMINELDRLFGILNGDMDSNSSGMMTTIGDNVASGTPAVAGTFSAAGAAFNSNLADGLNSARYMVDDALSQVTLQVQQHLAPMVDYVQSIGAKMMDTLQGAVNQFGGSLGDITGKVNNMVNSAGAKAGEALSGFPKFLSKIPLIGPALGTAAAGIGNFFRNAASHVRGFFHQIPHIGSTIKNVTAGISSFAKSASDGLSDVGENIASGLRTGMDSLNSMANSGAWADMAAGVVNTAKSAFGIHSPSRLMRDEVGVYLAEGLMVGFNDKATLEQGAGELSRNLTDAARGAGSGMVDEMASTAREIEDTFRGMNLDLAGGVAIGTSYSQVGSQLSTGTAYSQPVNPNYPVGSQKGSGGVTFSGPLVTVSRMEVRNDQDIRELSNQLSRDINRELRAQGVLS